MSWPWPAEVSVVAHSEVITHALPAGLSGKAGPGDSARQPAWEAVAEHMQYAADREYDAAREFAQPSPLAPIPLTLRVTPRRSPASRSQSTRWRRRSASGFTGVQIFTRSTDVQHAPVNALGLKQGVCRDYAQVMIAGLRSLGLAARYVSGYLLTEPPPGKPRLIGADASHARVSVYCPKDGWLDFDPTNNCLAGESHVKLAYGRDWRGCRRYVASFAVAARRS